jgi:sugar O-acyltransferase (sialic acid O-acetyltransferase NeuD family)
MLKASADTPFIIYGAGGHARVALDAARLSGRSPKFIIDDNPVQSNLFGIPILKSTDKRWKVLKRFKYIVAIGKNDTRRSIYNKLIEQGGAPCSVIHPSAIISDYAQIGEGSVVMAGVAINPGAVIGNNSILNTNCSVDHDCQIGDHVHLCPGTHLAGTVKVGNLSMIGTGSAIIPGIKIGAMVIVGAGSVVVRDLPDGALAFGNPARQKHI